MIPFSLLKIRPPLMNTILSFLISNTVDDVFESLGSSSPCYRKDAVYELVCLPIVPDAVLHDLSPFLSRLEILEALSK
uniref:Uncharacterized protein n=1 Tax=Hyaloperonospora arabidopsidis (strain Emoy2) TaxID=559515 RepID=M4BZG1_HYAAE